MSDTSRSIDSACHTDVEGNYKNFTAGLFAIADAIRYAADTVNAGSSYEPGGIALLGKQLGDGLNSISKVISKASYNHLR